MKFKFKLIIALIVLVIVGIGYVNSIYFNQQTKSCLVTGKESVHIQGKNQYRVYTTCGTYKIEDSLSIFRYNSSDLYGSIIQNTNYDIHSGGYRLSFLSIFPNIISVNKTQQNFEH